MKSIDEDAAIDRELAPLETAAEILAYTYRCRGGEPALRELLDIFLAADNPPYRETLKGIADEIAQAGMKKVAKIVAEYAAQAPENMEHYVCPEYVAASPAYLRFWLQAQKNRYPGFDERKVVYPDE